MGYIQFVLVSANYWVLSLSPVGHCPFVHLGRNTVHDEGSGAADHENTLLDIAVLYVLSVRSKHIVACILARSL